MDFLKDFLSKLAERTPLAFLGALFIVIAVIGGYPPMHLEVGLPWRIVSLFVGIALICVAAYLALHEATPPIDCGAYEISISSPQDNETLTPPVTVSGRCKKLPKGYELWVFSISGTGTTARYWPQNSSEIKDETWKVMTFPSSNWQPNTRRKYGVFLVGMNGQTLARYYKTVGSEISSKGIPSPGITELTRDIVQCGPAREVILK